MLNKEKEFVEWVEWVMAGMETNNQPLRKFEEIYFFNEGGSQRKESEQEVFLGDLLSHQHSRILYIVN